MRKKIHIYISVALINFSFISNLRKQSLFCAATMFPCLYGGGGGGDAGKILELQKHQFVLKRILTSEIRLLPPITTARTFEWTNLSSKQIRVADNKGGKNSATTLRLLSTS